MSPANAQTKPAALPDGVTAKEVKFFSEAVQCYAKIFTPKGFTADGKAPAIVLAPTPGETAASIDKYAAQMAGRGLVAMTIDYRQGRAEVLVLRQEGEDYQAKRVG